MESLGLEVEVPSAQDLVLVATFVAAAVGVAASDWTVLVALANVLHLVSRVSRSRLVYLSLWMERSYLTALYELSRSQTAIRVIRIGWMWILPPRSRSTALRMCCMYDSSASPVFISILDRKETLFISANSPVGAWT